MSPLCLVTSVALIALIACRQDPPLTSQEGLDAPDPFEAEVARLENVLTELRAENRELLDALESAIARAERAERLAARPERSVEVPRAVPEPATDPESDARVRQRAEEYRRKIVGDSAGAAPIPPLPKRPGLYAADVRSRVTEQNSTYWRWSWQLTVTSAESRPVGFSVQVDFLDGEGFIVATDFESGFTIGIQGRETYDGSHLVSAEIAPRVASVRATLIPR